MHEFTAPLRHGSVRYLLQNMPPNNVVQRPNGNSTIDFAVKPVWNYILSASGEILVAAEDFGWIKHTFDCSRPGRLVSRSDWFRGRPASIN